MSWTKKFISYLMLLILIAFIFEVMSYAALHILDKRRAKEVFSIRDFTERVDDARFVTMRKNFFYVGGRGKDTWQIETDENGFRIPPKASVRGIHNTKTFLFIGDSVPFGWGVNAPGSLPYIFQEKNKIFNVINGAVPSYSLAQAVSRLKAEFSNTQNISYIYLQIYDPVSQYAQYGARWHEFDNWTNASIRMKDICSIIASENFLYKSRLVRLVNEVYLRYTECSNTTIEPNSKSDQIFINHIKKQLREASDFAHSKGAILIVAPLVSPPKASERGNLPEVYSRTINILNNVLESESESGRYKFIDLRKLLKADEDFIDLCCHLSEKGANKVSDALVFSR
jgi:hypothetical protein